jgi:hypothetical protein
MRGASRGRTTGSDWDVPEGWVADGKTFLPRKDISPDLIHLVYCCAPYGKLNLQLQQFGTGMRAIFEIFCGKY